MAQLSAFNLKGWIDAHRHLLEPPVGNALVFKDSDFQVMIVGGPNRRNDYHIDPYEELFYQIEGDIVLKVVEEGRPRDIPILIGGFADAAVRRRAGGRLAPRDALSGRDGARLRRKNPEMCTACHGSQIPN